MFKRPFAVNVDTNSTVSVEHEIEISEMSVAHAHRLVDHTEDSAIRVLLAGAVVVSAAQIVVHIVKTKIR